MKEKRLSKTEENLIKHGAELTDINTESRIVLIKIEVEIIVPIKAKLITYFGGDNALLIKGKIYKPDVNFYRSTNKVDINVQPQDIGCECVWIESRYIDIIEDEESKS